MPTGDSLFADAAKSLTGVVAFLLAFAPGFVAVKAFDTYAESEPRKVNADLVYEIVGYSAVTYAFASPVLAFMAWRWPSVSVATRYWFLCVAMILAVLIVPYAFGAYQAWMQKRTERTASRFIGSIATPWDYAFGNRRLSIVEVQMSDGSSVFGMAGAISNYPHDREIFISQIWDSANGLPTQPIADSRGILIFASDIAAVRFHKNPLGGDGQ